MSVSLVACGPYFDERGLVTSLILFLLVKPAAYFAFILAFRYRTTRPTPMRLRQAAMLTVARAALGVGIIGAGAAVLVAVGQESFPAWPWICLYGERVFSWWLVGSRGAGLHGRRLVGWTISGTLINVAFDLGMIAGLLSGWLPPVAITGAVGAFVAVLFVVGHRASLKRRFATGSICLDCGYDLHGNVSGRCPECGVPAAACR